MKKIILLSLISLSVFLAGSSSVIAQDEIGLVIPVEIFACNYNDGKGSADLDKVVNKWSTWADKRDLDDYAAWTLTPYYFGPEQEFDVIWLGAAKDAVALGKVQDAYLTGDHGLRGAFNEVLSCNAHGNFASLNYKQLPENATPGNSVITFSDCSYKDGATFSALQGAMSEWSQHLSDAGSTGAIFHWYPVYGGGQEEFSFKWIGVNQNLEDLGGDYERYGNGGGYAVNNRLFNDLIDCDSRRVYLAQNRRSAQLR